MIRTRFLNFVRTKEFLNTLQEIFTNLWKTCMPFLLSLPIGSAITNQLYGVFVSKTNKVIGTICLWNISLKNHRGEIGYELQADYWGKGITNEAIKIVLDYGFNTLKLHSIEGVVDPNNAASIKLLEKNGFVREGYFKENYFHNGGFLDSAVYSLVAPL
jgi:RimJ/RimL family protein N-acetyltransferase